MWTEVFGFSLNLVLVSALHFPFDKLDQNDYRLPSDIIPTHYVLELQPDIYGKNESNFDHRGKVRIHMQCIRNTDRIVLHSADLDIDETKTLYQEIGETSNKTIAVSWLRDEEREFLIANLSSPAFGGRKYLLEIVFSARLHERASGIYFRSYQTEKNETEYFVSTNLAPTFARYVFPCFDEPGFKAIFDISVLRKRPYHTLSNMPIRLSKERNDGWVLDSFNSTVRMSTYILGIFISKFASVETKTRSGVVNKVWSKSDDVDKLQFFANYTAEVLQSVEDYFGIPFPLPKIDHIAHPYFMYNAMENWGIIMYKANRLLYEPGHGEPISLNTHMYTAAHELGHMLFGNLVTMKWWTDLFLKEGFAEVLAVSIIGSKGSPLFSEEFFCAQKRRLARRLDSYSAAQPTRYPYAETRSDIIKAYNKYTLYAKGGTLNRMFRFAFGNETFKLGLQKYLHEKKYQAADQWDLINSLQEVEKRNGDREGNYDMNVTSFIGSWLWQPGFPVVTIRNAETSLILEQERFLYPGLGEIPNGEDANATEKLMNVRYDIPFLMRHHCDKEKKEKDLRTIWLPRDKGSVRINKPCGDDRWLIGNAFAHGYYVVNYEKDMWMNIASQLHKDYSVFTTAERANILDDAFAMVRYGKLDFNVFMNLVSYIKKEKRFLPWRVFLEEIEDLHYVSKSHTTKIGDFIRDMVSEVYDSLKWEPLTDHVESELTRDIIKAACSHGYGPCVDRATELLENLRDGKDFGLEIDGLNATIACSARLELSEVEREASFDNFIQQLEMDQFDDNQLPVFTGLVCNQNLDVPKSLFLRVFSNATLIDLLPWDILSVLVMRITGHVNSTTFFLETMTQNLAVLNETKRSRSFMTSRDHMNRLVNGMNSEQDRKMFLNLLLTKNTDGDNSTEPYIINSNPMRVYQDRITNNLAWKKLNREALINLDYRILDGEGRWGSVVDSAVSVRASLLFVLLSSESLVEMENSLHRTYHEEDPCSQVGSMDSSLERESLESISLSVLSPVPEETRKHVPTHFDTKKSWLILFCGYLMQIIVMGMLHTYGIFYVAFLKEFDRGEALTAFVGSSAYGLNMLSGSIVGILQQKLQTRFIMIMGCSLCAISCLISSFVIRMELLFVTFSVIFGLGSSMCYTPTICLPQAYFIKHLSLATGFMMAGSSSGTLIMSPIVTILIEEFGWRITFRVFSILCLCCIPFLLIITPPPTKEINLRNCESRKMLAELRIWKNRVFIVWASAVTLAMFSYNTLGVHLIAYGQDKGISAARGSHFLFAFGLSASIGRVIWGKILQAEILNWTNAHQCAMIATGTAHTFLPIFQNYDSILSYVVVVGLLDGGYTVLLPLLTSQFVGSDRAPVVWGFVISTASIAFMLGPAVTGILRASRGAYDLAFHIMGLTMILAGLIEFLLPWARRTAKPEKNLIRVFSEIYPGVNLEDMDAFDSAAASEDDETEIFAVLEMQRMKGRRCNSMSGRRSKVSFGGVTSPCSQMSRASQYIHVPAPDKVAQQIPTRRRCHSESTEMKDAPEPDYAKSSLQVASTSIENKTYASSSGDTVISSNQDENGNVESRTWDASRVASLDTVHEHEILKIINNNEEQTRVE